VQVGIDADLAAPIAGAVAANANVAAPVSAAVSANIGTIDSDSIALASQNAVISQHLEDVIASERQPGLGDRPVTRRDRRRHEHHSRNDWRTGWRPSRAPAGPRRRPRAPRRGRRLGLSAAAVARPPRDGQMVQVTPLLFKLLDAIDGERDDETLAAMLSERCGKHVTAEDVRFLIEKRLRPLGVLQLPDGSEPAVKKMNPLLALRLKLVVSSPADTRLIPRRSSSSSARPWSRPSSSRFS
jgi:hypothetical protein